MGFYKQRFRLDERRYEFNLRNVRLIIIIVHAFLVEQRTVVKERLFDDGLLFVLWNRFCFFGKKGYFFS